MTTGTLKIGTLTTGRALRTWTILLCLVASSLALTSNATADLISAEEFKDCELHVVGIYSPKDQNKDDRVFVEVKATENPIVLVLSGYFGAQWNVALAEDANVRQIIVAGYFEHSIEGVSDSIPTEFITYFPKGDKSKKDYFWAYSWHTQNGRQLRKRLQEITGLSVSTFQGEYSGKAFLVDGKRGQLSKQDAPVPRQQQHKSTAEKLRQTGLAAKIQLLELTNKFGPRHPAVVQLERSVEMIQAELNRIGESTDLDGPIADSGNTPPKEDQETDPGKVIESLVRQAFQLETQLQQARVERAEADLNRIKAQLKRRQEAAEKIIADRVSQLVKSGTANSKPIDVSADLLSSEGWAAWRKHDWRTALGKFQSALKQDPDVEHARNGLGWTYVHLREYDKAIVEFKTILADTPLHPGALNGLGQSLLAQGKLDEAETELLKATEDVIKEVGEGEAVRRGVTAAWHGLVRTYLQKKDTENAKKWIERYLKHKPNDPMMLQMLEAANEADPEN